MSTSIKSALSSVLTALTKEYPEYSWQAETRKATAVAIAGLAGGLGMTVGVMAVLNTPAEEAAKPLEQVYEETHKELACASYEVGGRHHLSAATAKVVTECTGIRYHY